VSVLSVDEVRTKRRKTHSECPALVHVKRRAAKPGERRKVVDAKRPEVARSFAPKTGHERHDMRIDVGQLREAPDESCERRLDPALWAIDVYGIWADQDDPHGPG
jgi:hypothetical protein